MTTLCADCCHFCEGTWASSDECRRPLSNRRSPVDGRLLDRLCASADAERSRRYTFFGRVRCGPEALFFEQADRRPAIVPKCDWCSVAASVVNLDGDNLCQPCATKWVRGEGQSVRDRDATLAETPSAAPAEGSQPGPKASPNE